jgi:hypothetical protein
MLFNFFKKKQIENNENIVAKLSYIFSKDYDTPVIDVEIQEYNDESMDGLCNILDTLGQDKTYFETIDIIKNFMIQDGQEEYLIKMISRLAPHSKSKIVDGSKQIELDKTCIRPSDIMINGG